MLKGTQMNTTREATRSIGWRLFLFTCNFKLWAFFIHAQIFRLLLKISVEKATTMSIVWFFVGPATAGHLLNEWTAWLEISVTGWTSGKLENANRSSSQVSLQFEVRNPIFKSGDPILVLSKLRTNETTLYLVRARFVVMGRFMTMARVATLLQCWRGLKWTPQGKQPGV